MRARARMNLVAAGIALVAMGLAGCGGGGDLGTATVEGRLGVASSAAKRSDRELPASAADGLIVGSLQQGLVVDSPETSLAGITLELVEWRGIPDSYDLHEVGVAGTAVPDEAGRFSFADVLAMTHGPPDHGQYLVNIVQPEDALVEYGSGGSFRWLTEGETLSLSLPVVTRLDFPLWFDPSNPSPPEQGPGNVQLAVDDPGSRLIYFTPHRGLGVYDPNRATVDVVRASSALNFSRHDGRVHVIDATGQVLLSLVGGIDQPARFLLIDLDIFTEATVSEFVDLDDSDTAAALADRVTIIDVPVDSGLPDPPPRDYYDASFRPVSVATADGKRFYLGELGSTYVIDTESRSVAEVWHDGAHLGAYNPTAGHLYLDVPGGTLRVRDAATGAVLGDLDIGARFLLGIVAFPDQPRTIVSYESAATPLEHRIAIIGADGTVESDHLAKDYLGIVDRYWDPAYEWGTCGPEFFQGEECPMCGPRSTDIGVVEGLSAIPRFDMVFDALHNRLMTGAGSASFELRDGVFYPMPGLVCGRFAWPDECTGHAYLDMLNEVTITQSLYDSSITCVMHIDGSDLTIPVTIAGEHSGWSAPVVMPSMGIGFVATDEAMTAIHYNNPEAAAQPAVRDMRGEITLP